MIADAARRGAYLNPTLHYEWGHEQARAAGPSGLTRRSPPVVDAPEQGFPMPVISAHYT
jgi:hypothetical protein